MVVDDHSAFRQVVRTLIQAAGGEVLECKDGYEAVRQYPRFRPDIVLMDIAMKGLDGLNATMQIKRGSPGARVYMLTQYDDSDLRLAAQEVGAAGYLLKDDLSQLQLLLNSPGPLTRAEPNEP